MNENKIFAGSVAADGRACCPTGSLVRSGVPTTPRASAGARNVWNWTISGGAVGTPRPTFKLARDLGNMPVYRRYLPPNGKMRRLTGVLPNPAVGRARSPSAPQPFVKRPILPTFGLPLGALGESALPGLGFGLPGQDGLTSAARIRCVLQSRQAEQCSVFTPETNEAWRRN